MQVEHHTKDHLARKVKSLDFYSDALTFVEFHLLREKSWGG